MARCWVLLLALVACSRGERPIVESLNVELVEGADVLGLDSAGVQPLVQKALANAGFTLKLGEPAPQDGPPRWRVEVAVGAQEPKLEGAPEGRASVAIALKRRSELAFDVSERAKVKAGSNLVDDIQASARLALETALANGSKYAQALVTLEPAKDAELERKLNDPNPAVKNAAVTLLVRRKKSTALPALMAQLKVESADDDQLRRTMGLMVELGDPGAAKPMIEALQRKNLLMQRELVFALSSLGGADAEAYLYVVSEGHDEPQLRHWAEQALDELKQKKSRQKPEGQ